MYDLCLYQHIRFLIHSCSIDGGVISTNDRTSDADADQDIVQDPVIGAILVRVVSEEDEVHEGGHDEGQQGAAAGTHQGHQLAKVWHLYHYNTGNRHQA